MKVLLWSPKGSGLHYGGPGMTAYRMLSQKSCYTDSDAHLVAEDSGGISNTVIDLVHGYPAQQTMELFDHQQFLGPIDGNLNQVIFLRKAKQWLGKHLQNYDIFYGLQGFDLTVTPAYFAQQRGLPAIIKVARHQSDLADKTSLLKRLYGAPARRRDRAKKLSGIISISKDISDELISYGIPHHKIFEIPNGVDINLFRPEPNDHKLQQIRQQFNLTEQPIILFTGTVVPRKQPHLLIQALSQLKIQGVEAQLVIAGPLNDLAYYADLQALVKQEKLDQLVKFIGFVKETYLLYQIADCFILPSLSEGMPNALLEAMATGCAAISTPVSGVSDLIDHAENGIIWQSSVNELSQHIRLILLDNQHKQYLGSRAREKIAQKFSAQQIFKQHFDLFQTLKQRAIYGVNTVPDTGLSPVKPLP